jgi:hypothetical protein
MRKAFMLGMAMVLTTFWAQACQTQHKVETVHRIEVAPMHITIDVNVRVDRALEDFFADLDKAEEKIRP